VTPALLSYPDCMNRGVIGLHDIAFNSKSTVVFGPRLRSFKWEKVSVIREGNPSYWSNPTESTTVEQSKRLARAS
jgi:hypothetical protein